MSIQLIHPIQSVKGVGEKFREIFARNGILTVMDLLMHFPANYIDISNVQDTLIYGEKRLFAVTAGSVRLSRNFKKRLSTLRVNARLGNQDVMIVMKQVQKIKQN